MNGKRIIVTNSVGALIAPTLQLWFERNATWTQIGETALFALVYSNTIGTIANLAFTLAQPRLHRSEPVKTWSLVVVILFVCNVIGCAIASAAIIALGLHH